MHSAIISMLLFVDAMMSLYYLVNREYYVYWVIGSAIFYFTCVFGRYFWVSIKIERGWYRERESNIHQLQETTASVIGTSAIVIAKPLMQQMTKNAVTTMVFVCLILMCLLVIKYVDYFMI